MQIRWFSFITQLRYMGIRNQFNMGLWIWIRWHHKWSHWVYLKCNLYTHHCDTQSNQIMWALSKIYFTQTKLHTEMKLTPLGTELQKVLWYISRVQCVLCGSAHAKVSLCFLPDTFQHFLVNIPNSIPYSLLTGETQMYWQWHKRNQCRKIRSIQ